jgi:lysyl-tRNA synthetase class II
MALRTFMEADAVFHELGHRQYELHNLRWLIKATRALGAHGLHGQIARYRARYAYLVARNTVAALLH